MSSDICHMAQNLARNCGYCVFPVLKSKYPATPHGFHDASNDPIAIAELWRQYPGRLIGVATGAKSGISVLDVDSGGWVADEKPAIIEKHEAARWWWRKNASRLPHTRILGTRSGGLHVVFQHRPGVGVSQGKIHQGIDTRGDGGYAVWWYGAGYPCHRHEPPAPWPDWLYEPLIHKPERVAKPIPRRATGTFKPNAEHVIKTAERWVTSASEGMKHERLRQAARLLGGISDAAGISEEYAVSLLIGRLPDTAKDLKGAEKTAHWGFEKGKLAPLELIASDDRWC
jgi:hypothetical protein